MYVILIQRCPSHILHVRLVWIFYLTWNNNKKNTLLPSAAQHKQMPKQMAYAIGRNALPLHSLFCWPCNVHVVIIIQIDVKGSYCGHEWHISGFAILDPDIFPAALAVGCVEKSKVQSPSHGIWIRGPTSPNIIHISCSYSVALVDIIHKTGSIVS